MALGLSGSNGGLGNENSSEIDLLNRPLEVSYFINNICNLACKHCYVGYEEPKGELSVLEWTNVFDKLIEKGALTFGNVGKEPLLSSDKTLDLLKHLAQKRKENPKIRFGFVTNATLLEEKIIDELAEISPNYIDISVDGSKKHHDYIRGNGNYEKTINNLKKLPDSLKGKVFISYTLMNHNKDSFKDMIKKMDNIGIKKFLISPYVATPSSKGELVLLNDKIVDFYNKVINGNEIDFSESKNIEILLKSDYDAQKPLIDKLVGRRVIDVNNLLIDDYGVIFNKYDQKNSSKVIINFMPFSDTLLSRAIRISHDGYVGGCLEMFHKDYTKRTKGNLKTKKIDEILKI
jgi:MoaA/NifB/PqqE/SkfB family radical SAM enzyme